jgi:hypothetical protein
MRQKLKCLRETAGSYIKLLLLSTRATGADSPKLVCVSHAFLGVHSKESVGLLCRPRSRLWRLQRHQKVVDA